MSVRFRHATVKIYRKTEKYPFYRIAFRGENGRVIRNFKTLKEARKAARSKAREIHSGNHVGASLPKAAARAYKFALSRLSDLAAHLNSKNPDFNAPEISFSLEDVILEYCAAKRLLQTPSLTDAAKGYLSTVGSVQRINLQKASDEFLNEREAKTEAPDGKRAALSSRMVYQDRLRMGKFTEALGTFDLCDLRPELLDLFFAEHLKDMAPRSRNHYRSTLSVFFKWCVRKAYLAENHALRKSNGLCPDGKAKEMAEVGDVEVYSAKEFATLLAKAQGPLQAIVAIAGLAGLRTEELLRLDWGDVWRRPSYIEVLARKAKTRSRRLVPIGPALAAWLEPFRGSKEGPVWSGKFVNFHEHMRELHATAKVSRRDNALRHSFISYRLAEIHNEHQVANEAGTSSQMIHRHYRELVTAQEATEWFAVPEGAVANPAGEQKGEKAAA